VGEVCWQRLRTAVCEKIGEEVHLEALLVYPADVLPDQPPRVLRERCSAAQSCNLRDQPTCCWSGTLPGYDPFI
jgi:hypothetical protein